MSVYIFTIHPRFGSCKQSISIDFPSSFCAPIRRARSARHNRDSWPRGYQSILHTWCAHLNNAIQCSSFSHLSEPPNSPPRSLFALVDELWILLKLSLCVCVLSFPWWCLGFFWLIHLSLLPSPFKIYTFSFDYLQRLTVTGVFHVKNSSLS